MRPLVLAALAAVVGCQSIRSEAPDTRRRVEAALADAVALALAPEADASTFARLVAYRGGDADRGWRDAVRPERPTERAVAEALLDDLRAALAEARQPDGRVRYAVEAYVSEPGEGVDWHVLTLAFAPADAAAEAVAVEAALVRGPDGFLLGRLSRSRP